MSRAVIDPDPGLVIEGKRVAHRSFDGVELNYFTAINSRFRKGMAVRILSTRSTILLVLVIMPMACQQARIGAVYNGTSTPISITYSLQAPKFHVDGQKVCILEADSHQRPRIRQGKLRRSVGGISEWTEVPDYLSTENPCEATIQLEPGYSAWIFTNYFCSDSRENMGDAEAEPGFAYLRVESADGSMEFTDWEMARQFRRVNNRLCLFEIR